MTEKEQPLQSEMMAIAREMSKEGQGVEEILEALRGKSSAIILSIKVMRDVMDISLEDAKQLVHYSRTWSDMRDPFAEVHEQAESLAQEHTVNVDPNGNRQIRIDLKKSKSPIRGDE